MRWSQSHQSRRFAWIAASFAALLFAGCDLVLGIDDVSSAEGPDGGQIISGVATDPAFRDANTPDAEGDLDNDAGDPPDAG